MARWFVDRSPQQGIPSVSLRRLLPDAHFLGCHDLVVSGCSADSRRIDPGQVFVAVRGARHDGHAFVSRALERGAAGVVAERVCPEAGRLQVIVPNARRAHAQLCQALAGGPSEQLPIIGVAGFAGRTPTALFLRSIFEAAGARYGLIGGLGWSDGVTAYPTGATEPGASALAEMLVAMIERGCAGGIVEVSVEALERRALEGIAFETAVLTDIRIPDALEDIARLRSAYGRLFRRVARSGATVVNADDPEVDLFGAVNLDAQRVAYSLEKTAEVTAEIEHQDMRGTRFRIRGFDREATVDLRLAGPRAVSHAVAAATVAFTRGLAPEDVVAGLESVTHIPGRLEAVREGQLFDVWVDSARTELELDEILTYLRSHCTGRIHCLVSADVEPSHSPGLARLVELKADRVVLSIENARVENSDALLDEMLAAFNRPGRVRVVPDRRLAIEAVLELAVSGDAVLIAGGSSRSIAIMDKRPVRCDDRSIAAMCLRQQQAVARRRSA